jgi:hypothetical protein
MEELVKIQTTLKAPKNLKNSFGGYNYRSCENILESLKPLLMEHGCIVTLSDSIIAVADRVYVEAVATITNKDGVSVSTKAYAREELTKKGMDASQITGSASSYARKYALNGLFAIDDTKDPDTDEYYKKTHQEEKPSTPKPSAPAQSGKTTITNEILDDNGKTDKLLQWMWRKWQDTGFASNFDAGAELAKAYHVDVDVLARFCSLFESFSRAMK